jgi:hypothetical protein
MAFISRVAIMPQVILFTRPGQSILSGHVMKAINSFLWLSVNAGLDLDPVFRYGPLFAVSETGNQNHHQMKTYEFSRTSRPDRYLFRSFFKPF